jgi:hypothetical protein
LPTRTSNDEAIQALADAVERLHQARAAFVGSVIVDEQFQGKTVWKGSVSQFDLSGHPTATRCYAWSEPGENGKVKYFAVLHSPPIDSPHKAVQASMIARQKT